MRATFLEKTAGVLTVTAALVALGVFLILASPIILIGAVVDLVDSGELQSKR